MKHIYSWATALLMTMLAGLCGTATAQTWTASAPADGTFYLYNVGAEKFLCSGYTWGTRASLTANGGVPVTLVSSGSGYNISTANLYDGRYLYSDGFMDNVNAVVWTFEAVSGQADTYKMKCDGKYLYWDGSGTETTSVGTAPSTDAAAQWKLVTQNARIADLANASADNPIDATFYIGNNYYAFGWGMTTGNNINPKYWSGTKATAYDGYSTWENDANFCVEQYHKVFDTYQALSLPSGKYALSAQGFYRNSVDYTSSTAVPYFYAGNAQKPFVHIDADGPDTKPSNISTAAQALALTNTYYKVEGIECSAEDGVLRIGARSDEHIDWCAFDNFTLKCLGLYIDGIALPLPNDLTTALTAGQWYYYDVVTSGKYTLEGNVSAMLYTADGNVLPSEAETETCVSTMPFTAGRIYFLTDESGAVLQISMSATSANIPQTTTFTIAAMNVDGLPTTKIGSLSLNADGPGEDGTTAIANKLATKGYDIIGVSEDFNYHTQLYTPLKDTYSWGTFSGGINVATALVYIPLKKSLDIDGLEIFYKTDGFSIADEVRTTWTRRHGYTDQGADSLINKGYRHYTVTVAEDMLVDFFLVHMDAETGALDIIARECQMAQLATDIQSNYNNGRPKIIMGDTNCRYTRDYLKAKFIDVLAADGTYDVSDCWVEYCMHDTYPNYGSDALMVDACGYETGEIVDKILYLNPTADTSVKLTLDKFYVDTDFTDDDGNALADHFPVVAQFTATIPQEPIDEYFAVIFTEKSLDSNSSKYFSTLSLPFTAEKPEELSMWVATSINDNGDFVHLDEYAESVLPATIPVVLQAGQTGTYYFYRTSATAPAEPSVNYLHGTPNGRLAPEDKDESISYFALANKSLGVGFYPLKASAGIPQYRAYLTTNSDEDLTVKSFDFTPDDEQTGIQNLDTEGLSIERIYQPDGTQVNRLQRGLNIVRLSDGTTRKVFVK